MKKTLHFLSGIPRSGSTVLAAILNQNPETHVSTTSGLVHALDGLANTWHSAGLLNENDPDRKKLAQTMRGMIDAFYEDTDKPVVIDKGRGWPIPIIMGAMSQVLGHNPKIIATVRPVPDCMASFVRVAKPENLDEFMYSGQLADHLKAAYISLQQGYEAMPECFLFVEYDNLLANPKGELERIHAFLGLAPFEYDLSNIDGTPVKEDDENLHGYAGMHDIKPELKKQHNDDTSRVRASQYMEVLSGKGSKGGAPDMTDDKTHQQWNTTVLADPDLTNTDKSDLIGLGERTASQTREQRTEGNIPMMQQMLHQIVTKNNLSDHDIYAAVTPNGINFEQARNLIDAAHPKDSADPMFTKLLDADLEYVRQYYPATSGGYADQAGAKSQNDALTYYTQRAYQLHQAGVPDAEIFSPKGSNSIYNGRTIDSWGAPVQSGAPKGATTGQHPFDISAALQNILSSIAGIGPGNQYGQPVLIQGGPQAGQQTREQSDHALAQSMWGQ